MKFKIKEIVNHKYLKEAGIQSPDEMAGGSYYNIFKYFEFKRRYKKFYKEYKKTGVFSPNTWCLDFYLYVWMYENICAYEDICCVDLNYHKFNYKDKEYTQKEMMDILKDMLVSYLKEDHFLPEDFDKLRSIEKEILDVWYLISPSMWW